MKENRTIPVCLFVISMVIGFLWPLYRLLQSDGWILDDELSHFMFSKAALQWPEILLDEWARPGRNLIHAFAAPFGLTVSRIFTLVLSMIAVWLTYRVAVKAGVAHAWSVPIFLCFQPWYPELSYPVLTQSPFMLVWILGVFLAQRERYALAAIAFGYLSLIRHEGIFITGLWGVWVCFQQQGCLRSLVEKGSLGERLRNGLRSLPHDLRLGAFTVAPILLLNLVAFVYQGRIPFLIYFDTNPTDVYGRGSLFHYVPLVYGAVGCVAVFLSAVGITLLVWRGRVLQRDWSLVFLTYPAYLVLHSIIFWKGSFASGGYYHFLMPMAPMFALLAANAFGAWMTAELKWRSLFWRYTIAAVAILSVVYQGLHMQHYQHQKQDWKNIMDGKAEYQQLFFAPVEQASEIALPIEKAWLSAQTLSDGEPIHCAHVYFYVIADMPDTEEFRRERLAPLSQFPVGSCYIWESKYADLEERTSLSMFEQNSNWSKLESWFSSADASTPSVILFQKTGDQPQEERIMPKGRNLSY